MLDRRRFLSVSARVAVISGMPGLLFARGPADARLVVLILRGGLDGLAAVAPYGEPRYRALRGSLAMDGPGPGDARLLKLDGLFGLHPALTGMHELYARGELAVVHAVATPYRERSHFDGQNVLENGTGSARAARDGWLNRAVGVLGQDGERALALAQNIPLVLRGPTSVSSWAPSRLPDADDDTLARVAELYAEDPLLAGRLQEALAARVLAGVAAAGVAHARAGGALQALARAAGRFLSAEDGPRIAVLETGGWDTHANQGAAQGNLATRLRGLDEGLAALRTELGVHWGRTVAIVVTEFGRTVAVNGTRGTDHGTAGCAFLAGGAVRGGRVVSDWPGLGSGALHEGRDLRATTDLRSVLKGVLIAHLGADEGRVEQTVFPASQEARPLQDLV